MRQWCALFCTLCLRARLNPKNHDSRNDRAGRIELRLQADGQVTVNMGVPQLEPAQIPFKAAQRQTRYELALNEQNIHLSAVSMGNPHAVLRVDEVDIAPVAEWGAAIETHPQFPQHGLM